jgi:hypothetical protein
LLWELNFQKKPDNKSSSQTLYNPPMSQTLQHILEEIRLLTPDELKQLRRNLSLEQLHIFDTEPLSSEERQQLLIQAGLRAGWNDSEMDIYDSLDPNY